MIQVAAQWFVPRAEKAGRMVDCGTKSGADAHYDRGEKPCASCQAAKNVLQIAYRAAHPGYHAKTKQKLWQQFLDAYGHICACCGETDERFLSIGHVGSGAEHGRQLGVSTGKTSAVLRDLKRRGWPVDVARTECFNCNMGAGLRGKGVCPHQLPPIDDPDEIVLFTVKEVMEAACLVA